MIRQRMERTDENPCVYGSRAIRAATLTMPIVGKTKDGVELQRRPLEAQRRLPTANRTERPNRPPNQADAAQRCSTSASEVQSAQFSRASTPAWPVQAIAPTSPNAATNASQRGTTSRSRNKQAPARARMRHGFPKRIQTGYRWDGPGAPAPERKASPKPQDPLSTWSAAPARPDRTRQRWRARPKRAGSCAIGGWRSHPASGAEPVRRRRGRKINAPAVDADAAK